MQLNQELKTNLPGVKYLIWLVILSVLLSYSMIFAPLTPFPMALIILFFGRLKAFLALMLGLIVTSFVSFQFFNVSGIFQNTQVLGVYLLSLLVAWAGSEVMLSGMHPIRGLHRSGATVLVILLGFYLSFETTLKETTISTIEKVITQEAKKISEQLEASLHQGSPDILELLTKLQNPQEFAREIWISLPKIVFISSFIWCWLLLLFLLRNQKYFPESNVKRKYDIHHLMAYRAPFILVYVVIAGLSIALIGGDRPLDWEINQNLHQITSFKSLDEVGYLILYCVGVFYFFQGFGVYHALLESLLISGIAKTILLVLSMAFLAVPLALTGLLDTWLDFRKYFKKRNIKKIEK